MKKNKAFTLTELLIALGIIGAIAAISIPSLMSSINNKILVTQLKSINGSIQQLASDQLITNKTKSLKETDFANPTLLLSDAYFAVAKTCSTADKAAADCWKTSGTNAIKYRKISDKSDATVSGPSYTSIVLKNGAVLGYKTRPDDAITGNADDKIIGEFCFDVNGNDYPNIVGRDYFCMVVTKKGKVIDDNNPTLSTAAKTTNCTGGDANYCYGAIVDSGWQMPY